MGGRDVNAWQRRSAEGMAGGEGRGGKAVWWPTMVVCRTLRNSCMLLGAAPVASSTCCVPSYTCLLVSTRGCEARCWRLRCAVWWAVLWVVVVQACGRLRL